MYQVTVFGRPVLHPMALQEADELACQLIYQVIGIGIMKVAE